MSLELTLSSTMTQLMMKQNNCTQEWEKLQFHLLKENNSQHRTTKKWKLDWEPLNRLYSMFKDTVKEMLQKQDLFNSANQLWISMKPETNSQHTHTKMIAEKQLNAWFHSVQTLNLISSLEIWLKIVTQITKIYVFSWRVLLKEFLQDVLKFLLMEKKKNLIKLRETK